jgi:signal peptidase I
MPNEPTASPLVPSDPATDASSAQTPSHGTSGAGVKETIESILIAFILAFVFRAFVVEAFVIPTGSMAPTLLGAHMRFTCDDCGWQFDVNYNSRSIGEDIEIPSHVPSVLMKEVETDPYGRRSLVQRVVPKTFTITCPNCGRRVPKQNEENPENDATNPPVFFGDRILVLKYIYLLHEPSRWDVVVFKSPDDPKYQMNYIKRLIGKPGEQIMVLDGDVYARSADDRPFVVQTKSYPVQQALWRIVYDNDFLPQGRSREDGSTWKQPWVKTDAAGGWNLDGRVFGFNGTGGIGGAIRFDPAANPNANALTDWIAYDVTQNQPNDHPNTYNPPAPAIWNAHVSDLKLELYYTRKSGDGTLKLELSKLGDTFTAEILAHSVKLIRRSADGKEQTLQERSYDFVSGRPAHMEFTNVDYQVTLRIDGKDWLQSTAEQYHPDIAALMSAFHANQKLPPPEVRIEAADQTCELSHVGLWRDVYYLNRGSRSDGEPFWSSPDNPIKLGADEYFVMGDNAIISGDARYWSNPIELPDEDLSAQAGRVPARFMLGKAIFVYWPAGYRPMPRLPGIIPNFGDMRFIH